MMLTITRCLKPSPSFLSGSLRSNGSVVRALHKASPIAARYYASFPEESRLLGRLRYVKDPKTVAVSPEDIPGKPRQTHQPSLAVDYWLSFQVSDSLTGATRSNIPLVVVRHVASLRA